MKHNTAELEGARLDIAVMRAEHCHKVGWVPRGLPERYSTDWRCGGPIIEREGIELHCIDRNGRRLNGEWLARASKKPLPLCFGPTPLIAAMRAFVASKLGDEVDL